ncbi:MAG: ATP synthase F1 subunit epsilon [Acidobacteria bacterium]|nr:MAG: ATP synthase F1 subunit epsilon [Acidobacteriota bacterium]
MSATIKLEIATPEAMVYADDVEMVTIPGADGQMGILPEHTRLMTYLVPGEMIIRKSGHDDFLAIGEGLVEITNSRILIATNMAISLDQIDESAAEEARQRAAARLREKLSSEEVASVNASLTRAVAQLHVKRRHR